VLVAHTLLQFEPGTTEADACAGLVDVGLLQPRTFDWDLIGQLGQQDRIGAMFGVHWRAALACTTQQYCELMTEFLSTFEHSLGRFPDPTVISFSLGRRVCDNTIPEFSVATGLYTSEEVTDPQFATRIQRIFRRTQPKGGD
jgi:hypothetical protein